MFKNRQQLPASHVLSFRDVTKDQNLFFLTDEDLTSSVLVVGASAQDREGQVFSPILDRLILLGHSGLVIDSSQASIGRALGRHKQSAVFIGASEQAHPVNLLEALSIQGLRTALSDICGDDGAGAVNDALLVYGYLKESAAHAPTLADLYEALVMAEQTVESIDRYLQVKARTISTTFAAELDINLRDPSGLMNIEKSHFSNGCVRVPSNRLLPILNSLRPFWADSLIRAKLCAVGKPLPLRKIIVELQKTVFLDMPETVFGKSCVLVASILIKAYREMVALLSTTDRASLAGGASWKSFLIVDECADHLREQDIAWFSASRSYADVNVLGTSSLSTLQRSLGAVSMLSLLSCIRTKVLLPTDDELTLAVLRKHEHDSQMLLDPKSATTCFIHKGCYPVISGEYSLEPSEPTPSTNPGNHVSLPGMRANDRYKGLSQAWYVIGSCDEIVTKAFLTEIRSRLPVGLENPAAVMANVIELPLASKPGIESFRSALLQVFSGSVDQRHLVFVSGAMDGEFLGALNGPELVKTVEGLVEQGYLESFHLAVSNQNTRLLLQRSVTKRTSTSELASHIALAIINGARQ
jgi:hypothetical protein